MPMSKYFEILIDESPQESAEHLTHFFGPWALLHENEKMPRCETCEKKMTPVFQFNLAEFQNLFGLENAGGFLQFFYCANENCDEFGSMDDVAADNFLVRIFEGPGSSLQKGKFDFPIHEIKFLALKEDNSSDPSTDDKLGGYPAWIQEESYSECPLCRNSSNMEFKIQLSLPEVQALPFPGDSSLYISQCKVHREKFGMVWQGF